MTKQVVLSVRYLENPLAPQWHAALIVNGQMDRVFVCDSLGAAVGQATNALDAFKLPFGTRIVARFDIAEPEVPNAENAG